MTLSRYYCALSILMMVVPSLIFPNMPFAADALPSQPLPRQHAERSFQELSRHERQASPPTSDSAARGAPMGTPGILSDEYLRGIGEGDLSKGRLMCQRVAELAARTDLAKQIRVRVTERAIDRLRERNGRTTEQEIEVVREEMVNELLRDVRVVDKQIDEAAGTCSCTAVMPRARIAPESLPVEGKTSPSPVLSAP